MTPKLHKEFEARLSYIRPYLKKQNQKTPWYWDSLKVNETCTIIKLYIPIYQIKHRNSILFCKDLTTLSDSETVMLLPVLFWVLINCL